MSEPLLIDRDFYKAKLKRFEPEGPIFFRIHTSRGVEWLSTGQTTFEGARAVTKQVDVEREEQKRAAEVLAIDVGQRTGTDPKNCETILEEWNAYIEPLFSPDTRYRSYVYIRAFLKEMALLTKSPTAATVDQVSRWVNTLGFESRSAKLFSAKKFFSYVRSMGYSPANPAELVRIRLRDMTIAERTSKETKPITEEEYRRLTTSEKMPPFWRTVTVIGYWTGFRMRDIICLEWASITEKSIFLYQMKTGDKVEHLFCDEAVAGGDLLPTLAAIPKNDSLYCFPEQREIALAPTKRKILSKEFQSLLIEHGIEGRRFHGIRHACALRLRALGRDDAQIQQSLGHRSHWSTAHYLDHDRGEDCI